MATTEELKQLVYQMAVQKGLGDYWPLIDYIVTHESGWNPNVQSSATDPNTGQRENSWGLFQNLISSSMGSGLGAGRTPQELQDPQINAEIALEHIRKELARGAPIQEAVDDWSVTHGVDVNSIVGGATQGTEGGVTMAGETKTNSVAQTRIDNMLAQADKLFATGLASDAIAGQALVESAATLAKVYGLGLAADTGTATTTTTTPSAQETAATGFDMEMALYEAEELAKTKGLDYAVQDFVNKLSASQEGRLEATAAQEYAMNLAPPGMTELKLAGWDKGLPLGGYMPSTYAEAMGQANVPQAPELQYQPGALPQASNLGAMSNTQTSTQIQVPYAGLPTEGGGQDTSNTLQAIRNYLQRSGGAVGGNLTGLIGGNLPLGG